jgi:hypothetical protein
LRKRRYAGCERAAQTDQHAQRCEGAIRNAALLAHWPQFTGTGVTTQASQGNRSLPATVPSATTPLT